MSVHDEKKKITVPDIIQMKLNHTRIAALTAYDALMARLLDESGVDLILVGDSAAMVMAGHDTTLPITMDQMVYHVQCVRRGVQRALLVADMPFLSYQVSIEEAIKNAGRYIKEGGAEAVKIEGGSAVISLIEKLVEIGIPVMGHLGLVPQSIHRFGSYKLQGKDPRDAKRIKKEAKLLQEAGVFSLVLEKVPASLAQDITAELSIPTIGIGAGPHCDGQILVTHDMLGMFDKFKPKFVRRYAELATTMREAFRSYIEDVRNENFPGPSEYYE